MRTNLSQPLCSSISYNRNDSPSENLFRRSRSLKSSSYKRHFSAFIVFFLSVLFPAVTNAQTTGNEAEWNGSGYSIKKVVSNTSIASGVNFSYTILFSAPAGATSVNIQDAIPAGLVVVNVPVPALVNGVTPVVAVTGAVGSQVVNYNLTSLPASSASSGSFTIVVKFPEGTTCNGTSARNRVGIRVNDTYQYTPFVVTTATAVEPWTISKSIVTGPVVNPNGGNCGYMMNPGTTVTYRISIMKSNGYWGNVIGQQNVTGAQVTDVLPAGAVFVSSTCGATLSSGNTYVWTPNSGTLDATNPWAYYYCDITVNYPAASFPNGSFVYNQTTLTGTSCNLSVSHTSNQTCIEVGTVIPNNSAYFQKYVQVTNRVPGCQGYYTIAFCNTGNTTLSAFNINDVLPAGVTVNSVQLIGANSTTLVNLSANSGANVIGSNLAAYFTSGTITYPVNSLDLNMTGSLPAGQCIYLYIYFTINANPTGTVVTNCASFNGLANSLTLPQKCTSFTVDAGHPDPCLLKDICSPQANYEPGDIIRFRLRVQNIGSATLTGASIQDILHANFSYVGNETYYVSNTYNTACSSGTSIPAGTTAWTGVSNSHSGNNLNWNLPPIASDCQSFYVGYCGYYGTWSLPYYYIEFDVQVDGAALPGVTPNNYSISGGNLSAPVQSNTVNALVVASFGQETEKQISIDNGTTYASSGNVAAGSTAKYRLNYKNTSNVPVSAIQLVDLLGKDDGTNDWLVLNRSVARGSQFDITYANNPATSLLPVNTLPVPTINFAAGANICLPAFGLNAGCLATTWNLTTDKNVRFNYGTFSLNPASKLIQDFDITVPSTATPQQTVCNDFAAVANANFLLNGNPQSVALTPIAAPPVCLTVNNAQSCCDSIKVSLIDNAAGPVGCCTKIVSNCAIDSVNVSVINGTISSATWNCGNIPSGYVGQSNYTFHANGCNVNLYTCFKATQTGVTVNYTLYLANGEVCTKSIRFECEPVTSSCCNDVKLEKVLNADGTASCCVKLTTKCEVKAIEVNIENGTIGSASWNCGAIPTGYIGSSNFTLVGNGCAVQLTNCIDPKVAGVVTVYYTITFANGETCKKAIEIKCEPVTSSCCNDVKLEKVLNADGTASCCVKLTTKCEVKSIEVNVLNGTIGSASWNCGTIPTGYIGSSNFTLDGNGCVVQLTNCIDPKVAGVVTVYYTITFANGETCKKVIEIKCEPIISSCCNDVKLEKVLNADGTASCCVKLTTKCEVKAIEVKILNGTVGSASWNCGTIPTGYIGSSNYTLGANGCAVQLTNCIDPKDAGVVTVYYTITFANGETCKKVIEIKCEPVTSSCCNDVKLEKVLNADGTASCCVKLTTKCEVKAIEVNIENGTIGSASWNCGAIPTGFIGSSNFTLVGNGCAAQLTNCVDPKEAGVVTVYYTITFANGETCKKAIEIKCEPVTSECCNEVKLEKIVNTDGTSGCCVKLTTKCEVKSIVVSVLNGTIGSANWNCGTIPSGYIGSSDFTLDANGCAIQLSNCIDPKATGPVKVYYYITFANGQVCKKFIELDCKIVATGCCALAEFKLKQKWPSLKTQIGVFSITNLDPSSPICKVEIHPSPAGTFIPGTLVVDGVTSSQSWNSSSIPTSGTLINPAANTINFSMLSNNYKGVVQICVIKCDETKCCFDFKWNVKPMINVDINVDPIAINDKLVAVSVNPMVNSNIENQVKYVSFGLMNESEAKEGGPEFFAISATRHEGDDYPKDLSANIGAYMGKHNVFFELEQPVESGSPLGAFNLVFTKQLPALGCTLFDTEGNILYTGEIKILGSEVSSSSVGALQMFEFINAYPNPSNGRFDATFATSTNRNIEIQMVNSAGQVIKKIKSTSYDAGIHKVNFEISGIANGMYKLLLISDGNVLSKSIAIK
jgi:uncharacterized repeat protein (TIGR01451 family)